MQNLFENTVKFNVILDGKVIATGDTRTQADIALASLNESDRLRATVVPVSGSGQTVLLG